MKKLLLGDEAIAQGALDAGLSGVYAYPGTPSTEITEYRPSPKKEMCTVNGVPMRKPLWKRHSVCRTWEKEHSFA